MSLIVASCQLPVASGQWPVAVLDGLGITLSIIQFALSIGMAIALAWVASKTRKIETLEEKLEETTSRLVDTKLVAAMAELRITIAGLAEQVKHIAGRLERGDDKFEQLGDGRQTLELRLLSKIGDLKDFVRENCASKGDFDSLSKRFAELQVVVARTEAARCEREAARCERESGA